MAAIQLRSMKSLSLSRDLCPLPSISAKTMIHGSLFRHSACEKSRRFFPTIGEKTRRNADVRLSSRVLSVRSIRRNPYCTILDLDQPRGMENLLDFPRCRRRRSSNNREWGGDLHTIGRRSTTYRFARFQHFFSLPTHADHLTSHEPPDIIRGCIASWLAVIFYRPGEKLSTPSPFIIYGLFIRSSGKSIMLDFASAFLVFSFVTSLDYYIYICTG